jgi:hypothetical protein
MSNMPLLSFFRRLLRKSGPAKLMLLTSSLGAALMFTCTTRAAILEDSRSMDTTPIEIELAGARYRIPRNYLFKADNWKGGPQERVSMRVVHPGFRPFGPDTRACILKLSKARCRIYEVAVLDKFPSSEEGFDNVRTSFRKQRPTRGPYGFEVFEVGPDAARSEYYRKIVDGKPIVFRCHVNKTEESDGVCHHVAHTKTGAALSYFFMKNSELADAVEVDLGLRKLIDSFYIGKSR